MNNLILKRIESARVALLSVRDSLSAKKVADMAKAAEVYAIRQKNTEAARYAHEINVEALRLEGQFLASEPKAEGSRNRAVTQGNRQTPTLKDRGISKKESSVAQMVAKAAQEAPELYESVKSGGKINDIRRHFKKAEHQARVKKANKDREKSPAQSNGPFDLILADPPWEYEHCESNNREIENHYPTMPLEKIKLARPDSTNPDCILFLWATAPKLVEALEVMRLWGFNYRSCAVWDKQSIGMGYWWRIQHELLLVGVKGKPGATPECERVGSIFIEKRGKHSAKPIAVYEWIERSFPEAVKLEMFCRSPRQGWSIMGNEV